jgi:alkylation response protein AidB-like acyl-CoA dehydrogenase
MTTLTAASTTPTVLSEEMLDRFGQRAEVYDRENRFFGEDFDDLRRSGYLRGPIPVELGGLGLNLAQFGAEQRRLAYRAPATALATNMHLYWLGVAATLRAAGDDSCLWMLEEGARGEIFAAGHGEAGNDLPLLLSTSRAERVDGGYRIYGHKIFGSLTPVWSRLGIHALDASDPDKPVIVHGFLTRDSQGFTIKQTWDVLGMRATRSDDTVLEGAFIPNERIVRALPAGFAGADLFVLSVFVWALTGFANVYTGIAQRALDLGIAAIRRRSSVAMGGRGLTYHPLLQHTVAEMALEVDAIVAQVDRLMSDWVNGVDHGGAWPAKIVGTKYRAVEGAKRVVDLALECTGGAGMFKGNELERLYRDVRCGGFHPANSPLVHEIVGKTALGVLGEEPRWG